MGIAQSFAVALGMLRLHKMRAFLTMLGVIIGVMSVTIIVMIQNGFDEYLKSQFRKLGADTMFVVFDPGRRTRGQTMAGIKELSTDDLQFVLNRASNLDTASATLSVPSVKATYGDKEASSAKITAVDENFRELNRFGITEGRFLNRADMDQRANVCVIGEDIRDRLFGKTDPIGKLVSIGGFALEVVGIVEKTEFMGDSTSHMMLIPITMAQKKWVGGKRIDMMMLRAKPGVSVDSAMSQVWRALMVRSNNRPVYRVDSRESILQVFGQVVGAAGTVLAAIAALSLLVGGIGIMNIMLVSVTERTKEIGLRKAVGAKRAAVLTQFLIEAATLSLIGGIIGMGIAWGLGQVVHLITMQMKWPNEGGFIAPFPVSAAVMSALFSALIGVVFGLYPAMSASKLDPIVALRTE